MSIQSETPVSVQTETSKPTRSMAIWERYNSVIIWLLLVAYLGVAAFLVTVLFPVQFVDRSQSGFFEPQGVIAIGVMGLIGVWLSMRTGFPDAWDPTVTNKQRLVTPLITGLLLGSLFLATDLVTNMSQLQQEHLNIRSTDVEFPASIFVYSSAAVFVEVVYRLFTIPFFLILISVFVRGQRLREGVF